MATDYRKVAERGRFPKMLEFVEFRFNKTLGGW